VTVLDSLRAAIASLGANPLRSVLTTLGIIIGVAAVIVMVAIGSGARSRVDGVIQSLGSNLIQVLPGARSFSGVRAASNLITERDVPAIRAGAPDAVLIAPFVRGTAQIIAGNQNWPTTAFGVTDEFFTAREWTIGEGRLFEPTETRGAKVVVLGATVAREMFPDGAPMGAVVRVNRVPFTVVGVLAEKGQTPFGADQDDAVFVPLDTARQRLFGRFASRPDMVDGITVKGRSAETLGKLEADLHEILSERHPPTDAGEGYNIRNLGQLLEAQASTSRVLALLLAAVASISLVVGGIGIMNIMLVSVTERTREIGLRMAVGARRRDILSQFLVEAVVLAFAGGLIGAALGIGASVAIARAAEWPVLVEPSAVAIACGFAAAVGVFFGYYPARKASRLDPIEALRYE
jgi:putative ABC transport system permease protein